MPAQLLKIITIYLIQYQEKLQITSVELSIKAYKGYKLVKRTHFSSYSRSKIAKKPTQRFISKIAKKPTQRFIPFTT